MLIKNAFQQNFLWFTCRKDGFPLFPQFGCEFFSTYVHGIACTLRLYLLVYLLVYLDAYTSSPKTQKDPH